MPPHQELSQTHNCVIEPRGNPKKRRDKVYVGCGAGFGGDRPMAALKLLQRVKELNYLVLECLAERTLAERYQAMVSGGDVDPVGAQEKVIEVSCTNSDSGTSFEKSYVPEDGVSTYLGAAPIVECLEKYQPNVIITSRVADAALFLAPMVYELGWNWDDLKVLAQGTLAGHLLECGCQLTGGYFMHPGDRHRDISLPSLLDVSLPYAEISFDGKVCVAKAEGSGGVLDFSTCTQQLLYEVGDPSAYVTPDVVIDIQNVSFQSLSTCRVLCTGAVPSGRSVPDELLRLVPKNCGWKAWGEISYGGYECVKRAKAAEYLVCPGVDFNILSYIVGVDSIKAAEIDENAASWATCKDIRLRMDGLFDSKQQAVHFTREFSALYTNGPAGGGGISTGYKKEIVLEKQLIGREHVFWKTGMKFTNGISSNTEESRDEDATSSCGENGPLQHAQANRQDSYLPRSPQATGTSAAPTGQKVPLYAVAHSRAGDKGNDLNFSIIPHFPPDIERLKMVVTPEWVKKVVSTLLTTSSFPDMDAVMKRDKWADEHVNVEIYEVKGVHSLNVVVRNILDGGVNCSRRIDRHGKTISDLILSQQVTRPPCLCSYTTTFLQQSDNPLVSPAKRKKKNNFPRWVFSKRSENKMSFTGTLDKCKACDKTVYVVDMLSLEGVPYHKSCFKCTHCKGTLVSRAPSKVSALFCGTQDKCATCGKTVYPLEKVTLEGECYHKSCFRCAHGGCPLTHSNYAALDGHLYCKHHFAQLFMEKGSYTHVLEASHKRSASTPPSEPAEPNPEESAQEEEAAAAAADDDDDNKEENPKPETP
ncbi:hypothetical protein Tsubulata_007187 [Turnera subulata]|uniref:LIM zinc-binding domain-containing protein n=1 Tax=Turnera subulata TaxID=218843 RepID=A0A9Q0J0E2_9ROSI|nr:hypothetical protein Tsubulata_007187 [Turnera subulata]